MLHLALVANVMTAIGAAPCVAPQLPAPVGVPPGRVQFALMPFGDASLTHFLYLSARRAWNGSMRRDSFPPRRRLIR